MAQFDSVTQFSSVSLTAAASLGATGVMTCADLTSKTWKSFSVLVTFTNESTPVATPGRKLVMYVGCSNTVLANDSAGTIASKARPLAKRYEFALPPGASKTASFATPVLPLSGSFVPLWIEHDEWPVGGVVDINIVQNE